MIELPRSTYYYRSTARAVELDDFRLLELIGVIQGELPGYGYRRVTYEFHRRGHPVNHRRVTRVMKATARLHPPYRQGQPIRQAYSR